LFIYINKLTKIMNNLHMNFDFVKIIKLQKNPVKSNKNYFEIAKKCLKKDGIWVCHYAAKG